MKVETELVNGQVRLSFLLDGTESDLKFAERVSNGLAGASLSLVRYKTDSGTVVDAKDDMYKVACAFKSALLACRALEEAKAVSAP